MTNKVKPFYIRTTDDMTPQMVQDAFDKCRELGVKDTELRDSLDCSYWVYFGVCGRDGLCYSDWSNSFHGGAQQITLDQLDEWLGLEVEQEWKNGDECLYKGEKAVVIGAHPNENTIIIDSCISGLEACDTTELSKPETPEQKAEREKKEEAAEMIQCLLDNYTECDDSAIEYVIDYLKECKSLGR